jgi:uncharacterized membrane protein
VGFTAFLTNAARVFEAIGAGVLVLGLIWSVVIATLRWRADGGRSGYRALRETFGGVLLLGLEILVAADLIRTVAVSPTWRNVVVLGLIVLIRTFLSFSLQVEIEGDLPWRRGSTGGLTARKGADEPNQPPGSDRSG